MIKHLIHFVFFISATFYSFTGIGQVVPKTVQTVHAIPPNSAENPELKHAIYPGGMEALARFLSNNIQYPELAKQAKTEGKVYISFTVLENGNTADHVVATGIKDDNGLNNEALRVSKLIQGFAPSMLNGKPVQEKMIIPIHFQLEAAKK